MSTNLRRRERTGKGTPRRLPWPAAFRRLLARVLLLLLCVIAVQAGHGSAAGEGNPEPGPPAVLLYPAIDPIVPSERAGHLGGVSAVSPTGQYSYRLDIDVPPGRAGVQPALAFVYSSGAAGNHGHLGVGWGLEGLSEIRRCPKTTATEGFADGIDYDNDDSFCLDGQKLRRVDGGAPDSLQGAEYRLERDTFSKILAHGDSGAGPDSFTVLAGKSGQIFDYARRVTPHRRQGGFDHPADLGRVRAVWLLSSVRDRSGNKMVYDYDVLENPETLGVETRLAWIHYTETHDGKPGKRRVELHYKGRKDPSFRYESGVRWETTSLLDKITLHGPDPVETELLGEYRLAYELSRDSGRSLLAAVTRCDARDVCLRAKQFRWWERPEPVGGAAPRPIAAYDLAVTPFDTAAGNLPDSVLVADFTGDGLDDLLYRVTYAGGYQPIYFHRTSRTAAGGVSFGAGVEVNAPGTEFSVVDLSRSRAADLDGDGRSEILAALDPNLSNAGVYPEAGYIAFVWDGGAERFEIPPGAEFLPGDTGLDVIQLSDANGDGLLDIFREEPDLGEGSGAADLGTWRLSLNDPEHPGTFSEFADTHLLSVQGALARAMDIDGDGRGDLLPIDHETVQDGTSDSTALPGATIGLGLGDGGEVVTNVAVRLRGINRLEWIDLNGDGLRDALYPHGANTQVRWNLGNGFGPFEALPSDIVPTQTAGMLPELGLRVADFDGDGIEDLVGFDNNDAFADEQIRLFRLRDGQIKGDELGFPGTAPLAHDDPNGNGDTLHYGWPYCRAGDFNGDGATDLVHAYVEWTSNDDGTAHASFQLRALIPRPGFVDRLIEVWDENAQDPTEVVFYSRTEPDANPLPACAWPQRCLRHGMITVARTATAAGGDRWMYRGKEYTYEDPRMDLWGRGFLGFGKVTVFDPQLRAQTVTTFDHATRIGTVYPYAGLPKNVTHLAPIFDTPADETTAWPELPDGPLLARVTSITNTYELAFTNPDAGTFVVHPTVTTTIESELPVAVTSTGVSITGGPAPGFRRLDTFTAYDAFDNAICVYGKRLGGTLRWTALTYENRVDDWLLGLVTRAEVTAADPASLPVAARVTAYGYDANGLLASVTLEPEGAGQVDGATDPSLERVTHIVRNADGLPEQVTVAAAVAGARKTFFAYDAEERMFPRATWNVKGHATRYAYHRGYGVPVLTDDPNGVQTATSYDGFARVRRVVPDGGTAVSVAYASGECRTAAALEKGLCTAVMADDGARHVVYADEYGRAWEVGERGFDGAMVYREQSYNLLGQPVRSTRPFTDYAGPTTITTFDSLGRIRAVRSPDTSTTWLDHTLTTTTLIDPEGHVSRVTRDSDGRLVRSERAGTAALTYSYGPFDQVAAIEDALGNVTSIHYDKRGRRTRLVDPDQGTTLFEYLGTGELRRSTHLASSSPDVPDLETEYRYDMLGRLRYRIDRDSEDGDPDAIETTEYHYDALHGRGKLRATRSPDGIETAHTYDEHSRPASIEWRVDGQLYKLEQGHDKTLGRPVRLRYPDAGGKSFELAYGYNPAGWLRSVGRAAPPPSPKVAALYQVNERTPDGSLKEAAFPGAGVIETRVHGLMGRLHNVTVQGADVLASLTYGHDLDGNVTYRRDAVADRTEKFSYDDADRLTQWDLAAPGPNGAPLLRSTRYQHDDLGNLTDTWIDGLLDEVHEIDPVRPHRLAGIHFLHGGGLRTYAHDARGRLESDSSGRQIQSTPFDLPRHVGHGAGEAHFAYDAFGARIKKTSWSGGQQTTTITVGGLYERRERTGGGADGADGADGPQVEHVFYVHGDGGPIAQVTYDESTGKETTVYLGRDGLGSMAVAFDASGTALERLFHEPFGQRTDLDGGPLENFTSPSGLAIGFTGQRHDDDLDLIDYRGRAYDPVQRRFLTADPFVWNAADSQSHNRYAYVRGNPLRYTDPTGFQEQPVGGYLRFDFNTMEQAVKDAYHSITGSKPPAPPPSPAPPPQPSAGSSDGLGKETGPAPPPPAPPPEPPSAAAKANDAPDPGFARYDPQAERQRGYAAGLILSGVPYGAVAAYALMEAGVLSPGTSQSREGLARGLAVGGVLWMAFKPTPAAPPATPTPSMAGGGPAPPMVVAPAGVGVLTSVGVLVNAAAGTGELTASLSTGGGDWHHVATDKNEVAEPKWTERFQKLFADGGLELKDPRNIVNVVGHKGPHPQAYHQEVYKRLTRATDGLSGDAYRDALVKELDILRDECGTPGTVLNKLITKP